MKEARQHTLGTWLAEGARFIGLNGWLIAVLGIPVAILLGSFAGLLLVILVAFSCQVTALLLAVFFEPPGSMLKLKRRFRLTRWGVVYSLVTGLFCLLAVAWGINLFCLTASFLLGGLLCSAVFSVLTLRDMDARWECPDHIFAGVPFSTRFHLRNNKSLLGTHALRIEGQSGRSGDQTEHRVPRLTPDEETSVSLRQSLPDRGPQPLPPAVVRSGFPFGLLETELVTRRRGDVLVLPRMGRIYDDQLLHYTGREAPSNLPIVRRDQQGEFRSLREYRPGDDPRHIHWATSARLHKLYVREFDRRATNSILILLDASMATGEPEQQQRRRERFEEAVSFVATLTALLTRQNMFYAFASYCPDLVTLPYQCSRGHMFALLDALARAEPTTVHSVEDLLASVDRRQRHGGACLVTPGPYAGRAPATVADSSMVTVDVSKPEFHEYFSAGV